MFSEYKALCRTERTFSYRELHYLRELLEELNSLGMLHKEGCVYAALTEVLIQINFNKQRFLNYVLAVIHEGIESLSSRDSKIEKLVGHRKEIWMMQLSAGAALLYDGPTVRSIRSWRVFGE